MMGKHYMSTLDLENIVNYLKISEKIATSGQPTLKQFNI
jgi:hypothetical protein